jgi:carbon-monoxide dehydrogenase medium subunit
MVTIAEYLRADSVEQVLTVLQDAALPIRLIAGGTDLLTRIQPDSPERVLAVDISTVCELEGISATNGTLRLGAATRLSDLCNSPHLSSGVWQTLALGASLVGSPQIRNLATLGGNICNASPAADMIPPLLVLDAEAELVSPRGSRIIPLAEFFVGPGQTILAADEILASVRLPEPPSGAVAAYHKHSPRRAMDLAVVGVAVLLARSAGQIQARIALGAVAPTPLRVTPAEGLLAETQRLDQDTIAKAARLAAEAARPISDVRASAEYRIAMVKTLTERALTQLAARLA